MHANEPAPAWREAASFSFGRRATVAAFSPDGKTLVLAGGADGVTGVVKLFDVATQQERLSLDGHLGMVNAATFSPDGQTLATGAGGEPTTGEVKLWEVATGKLLMSLSPEEGYALALAFSPDGKTLAVGSGHALGKRYFGQASFFDIASGRKLPLRLKGAQGEVTGLAYVDDGKQLVTSGSRFDETAGREVWEVKLWNAADGGEQAELFTSVGPNVDAVYFQMRGLAISADGKRIAGVGRDATQGADRGMLRMWGVNPSADWGFLSDEKTPILFCAAFSPDGKTLAAGGVDDAIHFWDMATNREQTPLPCFAGAAFCAAFSPDGKHLIAGGVAIDAEQRQSGIVKWWTRR
ncbi:MAG TPA: hypothetical protein VHB99_18155 [Pirellulales bacterium]|nr:hypothetical protein [Pirellulales bacterium]